MTDHYGGDDDVQNLSDCGGGNAISKDHGDDHHDNDPRKRETEQSTTTDEDVSNDDHQTMLDLLGPAYARSFQYWKSVLYSSVLVGLFMGALSLAFVNYFTVIDEYTWNSGAYRAALQTHQGGDNGGENAEDADAGVDVEPLLLGNGQVWYVGMVAGGGLAVGIVKCLWTFAFPSHPFPDKIPGFLKEVQELQSHDPLLSLPILVTSGLSIGLGAVVGPEAALSAAGAAVGTVIQRNWGSSLTFCCRRNPSPMLPVSAGGDNQARGTTAYTPTFLDKFYAAILPDMRNDPLCTMDGMSAAFAGLFPAQFLSPLLVYELGGHWGPGGRLHVAESLARAGFASTAAYALYVSVKGQTLLHSVQLPVAAYEVLGSFQLVWILYGWLMGIVCGLVGFVGFLFLAIGTVLGKAVTRRLNALGDKLPLPFDGFAGKLLTPTIGGALVGALAVAAPMALGDGAVQITSVLSLSDELGVGTLAGTATIKFVAFGISLGFGFVGGPLFPLVFVGACTGVIVHLLVPDVPLILAYACCLVGVPSAILPGFFFMTSMASAFLVLGGPATTIVFFTVVVSYSTVCGMGIVQKLLLKAAASGKEEEEEEEETSNGKDRTLNPLLQKAWNARRRATTIESLRRRRPIRDTPQQKPQQQQPPPPSSPASPSDGAEEPVAPPLRREPWPPAPPPEADASDLTSFSV
jgi:H+/Cl- antiporter ClcA